MNSVQLIYIAVNSFVGSIMAKIRLRLEALEMRKKGMSYSQIKEKLGVSKSTLSLWLREYPLSKERVRELQGDNERKIERYRETMFEKREMRRRNVFVTEKRRLMPMSNNEFYISGLMLYWGEGAKTRPAQLSLSNTDDALLRFYVGWLVGALNVKRSSIRVKLHIFENMDDSAMVKYWSKTLGLPADQFKEPYVKKSSSGRITYKSRGKGTCNVIVYGRDYFEKVMMGIQAVSGEYRSLG